MNWYVIAGLRFAGYPRDNEFAFCVYADETLLIAYPHRSGLNRINVIVGGSACLTAIVVFFAVVLNVNSRFCGWLTRVCSAVVKVPPFGLMWL